MTDFTNKLLNYLTIDGQISETPLVIYANDCPDVETFAEALFSVADRYKDSDEIIVRYSKPEDKKTGEVRVCFEVVKDKNKDGRN